MLFLLAYFSFDEHALIDLPAMINYALNVSKQDQLYYAGHSQGTMMGFAGFSSDQVLASKVKRFYALAPVMSVKHIDGALKYLSDFYKEIVVSTLLDSLILMCFSALCRRFSIYSIMVNFFQRMGLFVS